MTAFGEIGHHHPRLNSTDPETAISFYVRQFTSTSKTSWGGLPALASPTMLQGDYPNDSLRISISDHAPIGA